MKRTVVIRGVFVDIYEEQVEPLEEIKALLEHGYVSSCRKALQGLEILRGRAYRPEVRELVGVADSKLAGLIRRGECPDL